MPENMKEKKKGMDDIYGGKDSGEDSFELSKTEEAANMIAESAKSTGNEVTYSEINSMLADSNFDKDALEEIYDLVENRNI